MCRQQLTRGRLLLRPQLALPVSEAASALGLLLLFLLEHSTAAVQIAPPKDACLSPLPRATDISLLEEGAEVAVLWHSCIACLQVLQALARSCLSRLAAQLPSGEGPRVCGAVAGACVLVLLDLSHVCAAVHLLAVSAAASEVAESEHRPGCRGTPGAAQSKV